MTHMKANDLAALDRAHALHPWQNLDPDPGDSPLVISRGEGCHLWDADGRQYLDAVGGLWCTQIGLGNAEMAKAIADQAQRLAFSSTFTDITNDPAALLAARLAALAPDGLSRVHFTTGGSTAIDSASDGPVRPGGARISRANPCGCAAAFLPRLDLRGDVDRVARR